MNEPQRAEFSLEKYRVSNFSFNYSDNQADEFLIEFSPKGLYNIESQSFLLTFGFRLFIKDSEANLIKGTLEANFKFRNIATFSEIPGFFYRNSIAIVFPYVRAFISTLSLQCNISPPIILPLYNLSGLESQLRENTQEEILTH